MGVEGCQKQTFPTEPIATQIIGQVFPTTIHNDAPTHEALQQQDVFRVTTIVHSVIMTQTTTQIQVKTKERREGILQKKLHHQTTRATEAPPLLRTQATEDQHLVAQQDQLQVAPLEVLVHQEEDKLMLRLNRFL
jgi:hypothetical protein